jgi:hypothetical protein
MTPLMQQGYKRPIADTDIWKLDDWDETETLYNRYVVLLFWLKKGNTYTCISNIRILSQIPEILEQGTSKTKTMAVTSSP